MTVGILGLGLIGGSLARAYTLQGHTVYAIQRNEDMLAFAMLAGAVHGKQRHQYYPWLVCPGLSGGWLLRRLGQGHHQNFLRQRAFLEIHYGTSLGHGRLPVVRL